MGEAIIVKKCEYELPYPGKGILCGAYSDDNTTYPNGLKWANYPICNCNNCPIKHPELLNGGLLGGEMPLMTRPGLLRVMREKYSEKAGKIYRAVLHGNNYEDENVRVEIVQGDIENRYRIDWKGK